MQYQLSKAKKHPANHHPIGACIQARPRSIQNTFLAF
jgi:hypothetical protein